ncbi:MAG: DEAD/DEAH box helicase family protein [Plesiomonas shigelloides]
MARKKPRYYQLEAMNSLLQAIRKAIGSGKSGRFVIDAAPATGKTLTMAMIAESVSSKGGSVLILSYQPVLCGQNYDECWEYQVPACMYASKFGKKQVNGNVVVATVGTIVNALETDFKNTRFDIVLIDECLTGDSLIETSDGMFRIDDPELKDKKIKCISEESGEIFYHKPVRVFSNGIRCVSSITTSCGVEIKCTDTHKLYSNGSWIRAAHLKSGSEIMVNASQDFVLKKLLRASAAVAKKLLQTLTSGGA